MNLDALRGYIQLASGLTDVTRDKARAAVRALVSQSETGVGAVLPGTLRSQVAAMTDELVSTGKANRDLLANLVRAEVDRSVTRLGLVSATQLEAALTRSRALERRVEQLERALAATTAAQKSATKKATTKKATTKKATTKKATTS